MEGWREGRWGGECMRGQGRNVSSHREDTFCLGPSASLGHGDPLVSRLLFCPICALVEVSSVLARAPESISRPPPQLTEAECSAEQQGPSALSLPVPLCPAPGWQVLPSWTRQWPQLLLSSSLKPLILSASW